MAAVDNVNFSRPDTALDSTKPISTITGLKKQDSFQRIFAEIKKIGLLKYTQKKRIERLREEILEEWGITEETWQKMSPQQRADLEKRLNEEVMKRLAAENVLKRNNENKQPTFTFDQSDSTVAIEDIGLKNAYFAIEKILEYHQLQPADQHTDPADNQSETKQASPKPRKRIFW